MEVSQKYELWGHKSGIYCIQPIDGHSFYSAAGDGWLVHWDVLHSSNGNLISKLDGQIFSMATHTGTDTVWLGDMNGGVYIVHADQKQLLQKRFMHQKGTYLILPVRSYMLTAGGDGAFSLWDVNDLVPMHTFRLSEAHIRAGAVHPDRPIMALGGGEGRIFLIETNNWQWIQTIEQAHDPSIFDVQFLPQNNLLLSCGRDAMIRLWHWETGSLVEEIPAHMFTVNALAFSPSGKYIASASRDKSIKIWDTEELRLQKVIDQTKEKYHLNSVNDISWLSNDLLVSASDDRSIRIWSVSEDQFD